MYGKILLLILAFLAGMSGPFAAIGRASGQVARNANLPFDNPISPPPSFSFKSLSQRKTGPESKIAWVGIEDTPTPDIRQKVSPAPQQTLPQVPAALSAYAGGQIAFTSYRDGNNEVYVMDADGANQVNLSNTPGAGDGQPVIGPTGQIAFISDRDGNLEIYTMDRDGGNQARLTHSAGDEGWMDWSPDGSQLVFVYNEGTTWRLETINVDGTGRTVLLENNQDEDLYDAAWSPDGSTIAFFWADSVNPGVYTVPATGGAETYLDLGTAEEPAWSPDGAKLAVTVVDYNNSISWIYVTDPDGSNPVQVSPGASFTMQAGKRTGGDNWPSWSPDGRRIVYTSDWAGGFQMLYVALADGSSSGTHFNLSASGASDDQPDWGPGGFIAPALWGPLSAYQTGGVNDPAAIHVYDGDTAQDTIVAQGYDLRLADLWDNWLVYQKLNAVGGYDIWVQELDSGVATNISLDLAASTSNHPHVDGGNVFWREVQGTATSVNAGFYVYAITSGTYSLLTFSPGQYNRYSRYLAEDGRYFFITDDNRPCLIDAGDLSSACAAYTGLALPAGVSGNTYAALEHGAGGNDVLATYTLSPSSRTQVVGGLEGVPALSGEMLAWIKGGKLYRQSLFDDLNPTQVAGDAGAFCLNADLLLWLDGSGGWAASQGAAAADYVGLDDFEGDADFTEPEDATTLALSPQAGGWQDRWLAQVTGGRVCYLDGGLKDGQPPHCVLKFAGFKIYADFEIFVEPGDTADIALRDGSYLLVRGGSYLVFRPFYPSSLETIQQSLDATFDVVTIKELEDAVDKYQQTGDTTGIDLGKLSNDLTAINAAAEELKVQAEAGIAAYVAAGKKPPQYLSLVSGGLDTVMGGSDRLGSFFGLLQVIENTGRFNYPFYRDKLNQAFRNYFETIARANKQGIFYPRDPNSVDYYNRTEVLLRMFARDGRAECFDERNWAAAFYADGTFQISSPRCGQVTWSKEQIASLMANADTDVLRREVLRPLFKDSLDWYNSVLGLFIPSEAALSFSLLAGSTKPQQVTVNAGRMRFQKLSALKRAIDAKTFTFPGARVHVWGTAFEAEIAGDGSGNAFVEAGMPVLANLSEAAPDAYGITWQDNPLPLAGPPGTAPLDVPYRDEALAPYVVELTPNENFALTPSNLEIKIRFSQAMDASSVTTHGLLTITHSTAGDFFAGALGDLSPAWDALQTTLTLTPPTPPGAGLYQMDLRLPTEVKSLGGVSVTGTPVSVQFAVVDPIGAGGGTITTPGGAALTVPGTARASGAEATAAAYEIHPTRVFSTPSELFAPGGRAYRFTPEAATFGTPATIVLPVPVVQAGAAIYRYTGSGDTWVKLGGEYAQAGTSISVAVDELGLYAVFWSLPRTSRVYLPHVVSGYSSGDSPGPGVAAGWQCDPFAGGVSCGKHLAGISLAAPGEGWAVGPKILLHYAHGTWRRAVDADLDLFDGFVPDFTAVDMLSPDEGWAVAEGGWLAHYTGGVWHTSRPSGGTLYGIDMLSAADGWLTSVNGTTYHYNGSAWQEVGTPASQPLYDIDMVASGDVWAVGGDNTPSSVILHYTGGSWQQVSSPSNRPLYAVDMLSADEGWAVGQGGTLLHYQSGGWSQVGSPTTADLNDIQMLSADEGWAVSADSQIYHYEAGTWTEVSGQAPDYEYPLHALAIVSPTEVWAVGDYGRMFYTRDGAWQQFAGVSDETPLLSEQFNTIDMVSNSEGWGGGKIGHIIYYDGDAWAYVPSPTTTEIRGLDMISASDGWAIASDGLPGASSAFLHYDGGSWQVVQSQSDVQLSGIDMVSASEGWAVGRKGILMHYSGGSWGFALSPTLEDLNAVAMVSADRGWAVGDNGTILAYEVGAWTEVASPTAQNLHDLSVVSELEAWAVGDDSTILHSFLGNWFQVDLPAGIVSSDLEAIQMLPNGEGWATGFWSPVLLHYQNGAWESYTESWAAAYDIDFTPNGEGWMVGAWFYGLLMHYR